MPLLRLPYPFRLFLLTVAVAAITWIGLHMSIAGSGLLQIFSPAGFTIVMIYIMGNRALTAVFFGALVNYVTITGSWFDGSVLAAGAVLEAFVGAAMLRRLPFSPVLRSIRDVSTLLFVSGAPATFAGAAVAVMVLDLPSPDLWSAAISLIVRWMGNLVGVLVLAPLMFLLRERHARTMEWKQLAELFITVLALHLLSRFVFRDPEFLGPLSFSLTFILFPLVLWIAIRTGMIGAVLSVYVVSTNATMAIHGSLWMTGGAPPSRALFLMDLFLIVIDATALILAALIEERASAARIIERNRERYTIISERTGQIIYDLDLRTGTVQWSGAITAVSGYDDREFLEFDLPQRNEAVHPDDRTELERTLREATDQCRNYAVEYRLRKQDGSYAMILDRGAVVADAESGRAYRMLGTMADITEVHRAAARLHSHEERFRILIEKSADGILLMDRKARITYASSAAAALLGRPPEEILGKSALFFIHPDEAKGYAFRFGRIAAETERTAALLGRVQHADGRWLIMEGMITNLLHNASVGALVLNFRDVTDRVNAEERLRRSLDEKEVLLKEVHHRVKNNMQVISSLLNLQSSGLRGERTVAMFRESQNRVKSMALVHEILYTSRDIASVNFAVYTKQLTASLRSSYGARTRSVSFVVRIPNIVLDIDQAIPCGLIMNELISNAIKHAFGKTRDGRITIDLHRRKERYRLTVRDNGTGMKTPVKRKQTLGLEIVHALTEQLKGTVTFTHERGTVVTIEFPALPSPSLIA